MNLKGWTAFRGMANRDWDSSGNLTFDFFDPYTHIFFLHLFGCFFFCLLSLIWETERRETRLIYFLGWFGNKKERAEDIAEEMGREISTDTREDEARAPCNCNRGFGGVGVCFCSYFYTCGSVMYARVCMMWG